MKREIKFRGRDLETDKFIYGDFVHYVPMSSFYGIVDEDGFAHEIHFGSVAQLIARDVRGEEVYEGDKVIRLAEMYDESAGYIVTEGKPMTAGFEHYVAICNGVIVKCEK